MLLFFPNTLYLGSCSNFGRYEIFYWQLRLLSFNKWGAWAFAGTHTRDIYWNRNIGCRSLAWWMSRLFLRCIGSILELDFYCMICTLKYLVLFLCTSLSIELDFACMFVNCSAGTCVNLHVIVLVLVNLIIYVKGDVVHIVLIAQIPTCWFAHACWMHRFCFVFWKVLGGNFCNWYDADRLQFIQVKITNIYTLNTLKTKKFTKTGRAGTGCASLVL